MNQPTREVVLVIQDAEEERFTTCEIRGRPQVPQIHVLITSTSTIDILKFMLVICDTDYKTTISRREFPSNTKHSRIPGHTILITFDPSTNPANDRASRVPLAPLLFRSSSHHPKRKSRAMSLNQGVNRLPGASNISISSCFETYLWSRISFGFGLIVTSAQMKRIWSRRDPFTITVAPQYIDRSEAVYLCKISHLVNGFLILGNSQPMFKLATVFSSSKSSRG